MNNLLTGIPETDMQIMLRLNIDTIGKFAFVNTQAYEIANDPYFWKLKFEYHNLPIIVEPQNLTGWLDEFINMTITVHDTKLILGIHAIEATRKHDPLNSILIPISPESPEYFKYELLTDFFGEKIESIPLTDFGGLFFRLNNDGTYKVGVDRDVDDNIELIEIDKVSKEKVYDLMVNILYYNPNPMSEILDARSIEFLLPYNKNLQAYNANDKRIIYKRFGIRDAIELQESEMNIV